MMLVTKNSDFQNTPFELEQIEPLLKVASSSSVRVFAMNDVRNLNTFKALENIPEFRSESTSSWSQAFEKALHSYSGKKEEFERWRTAFSDSGKKVHDKKTASEPLGIFTARASYSKNPLLQG